MTDSHDLMHLLRSMDPALNPGSYVFVTLPAGQSLSPNDIVASIREPEGVSAVVAADVAQREGLPSQFQCAWITLTVHSALDAVGLTGAFSMALGSAGISCNVVAGAFHDHIFVPVERANDALGVLRALQVGAGRASG
jgi:uncharacterized protein